MNINLNKLSPEIRNLLDTVSQLAQKMHLRVYLVGGIVRDIILNRINLDLDIVVEGNAITLAESYAKHFSVKFTKHHSFGTATVTLENFKIDFATARKESYRKSGALPEVIPAGLKEDLFRRDFTINAMAVSLNKDDYGKLIDIYGGLADIKNKQIRVLHDKSFFDDPTRMLRAIRFEQRFEFSIEKGTLNLFKIARTNKLLNLVHPHRLRDELILIFKESSPECCVKRIHELLDFSFINKDLHIKRGDLDLFKRIRLAILFYKNNCKYHRKIDEWIIYLMGLLFSLSLRDIELMLEVFGFRKGELIRIVSAKQYVKAIEKFKYKIKPHSIYEYLDPLSFETILFFYGYCRNKKIQKNIEYFLNHLVHVRLKIKGRDLAASKLQPYNLYTMTLKEMLYAKLDKGFASKEEELAAAIAIFNKLKQNRPENS